MEGNLLERTMESVSLIWLLSLLLKGLVVSAVALGISSILSKDPAARMIVWRGLFVGLILLPVVALVQLMLSVSTAGIALLDVSGLSRAVVGSLGIDAATEGTDSTAWMSSAGRIVLSVWLLGTFLAAMRLFYGFAQARILLAESRIAPELSLHELVRRCGDRLALKYDVGVLVSSESQVPFVYGWLNPKLVLPTEALSWEPHRLEATVVHELTHIARRDPLTLAISSLATILNWYNPLVWLALDRMRYDMEVACDNQVLNAGTRASVYAEHLLDIAGRLVGRDRRLPMTSTLLRKRTLEARIMTILRGSRSKRALSSRTSVLAMVVALAFVFVIGGVNVAIGSQKEKLPGPEDFVELEVKPEPITFNAPEYPKEAKKKGVEGVVWIQALVLKDGTIGEVLVKKSSGVKMLDKAAAKVAKTNVFKPGIADGKATACWITYKVDFTLEDSDKKVKKTKKGKKG